ncbi:MAG TPA: phasin family protein [Thauera sp.]|uniref:phasin family protein n=1 Tax=Thauera sp. TaxID=1905334 RepID=UPI002C52CE70|nr:phasin family protein [Thauera sp.]HRP24336.1 phasin family protein [Thauera sp.]HRP64995.1 phasin family protein [Thauera sp.]
MNASPEKLLSTVKSAAEARVNEMAVASDSLLSAVEHLTALNLNTARSVLDDTIALNKAVTAARDPKALVELQIGTVTPSLQKGFAYFKAVGSIASQTQADLFKLVEAGMSQWLQAVIVTLEGLNRNAPGSEFAVKALKTAVANASSAYEGATEAVRQASEVAQANADQAAAAAVEAVSKTTKATVTLLKSAA